MQKVSQKGFISNFLLINYLCTSASIKFYTKIYGNFYIAKFILIKIDHLLEITRLLLRARRSFWFFFHEKCNERVFHNRVKIVFARIFEANYEKEHLPLMDSKSKNNFPYQNIFQPCDHAVLICTQNLLQKTIILLKWIIVPFQVIGGV